MLIYFTVLSSQPFERKLPFGLALLKFHSGLLMCFVGLFALLLGFYGYIIFLALVGAGIYLMVGGYRDGKRLARTRRSSESQEDR